MRLFFRLFRFCRLLSCLHAICSSDKKLRNHTHVVKILDWSHIVRYRELLTNHLCLVFVLDPILLDEKSIPFVHR